MKPTLALRSFLLGSTLLVTTTSLHAIEYWWDSTSPGTTAGFGTTDGTWGTSAFIGTSDLGTGATANTATTSSDILNIGTATLSYGDATPTITVLTTRAIGTIIVGAGNTNGITISGGTAINLGGAATITNNDTAVFAIETAITGSSGLVKSGAGSVTLGGTSTFTGNIAINGGTLQMQGGGGAVLGSGTFAGNISIASGANLVFNSGNAQILSGVISGAGSNRLAGANTVTLSNANTYTGDSVLIGGFTSARWALNNNLALQNSALDTGSAVSGRLIFGAGVTTPTFGGLKGSVALASVALTNYNLVTSLTLNPGSGFSPSYSGNLANGAAGMTLTKSGLGKQTLSGTNSYTGATTVNAGTLQFANQVSLYNNTPASWTAANINVKSAATLALNVDSAGTAGFTNSSINTLLTNISVANTAAQGLQSGAILGFDTSTATAGTFTQGNAIANSTGASGGAIGLTKLGTGTLVLDKTNTYTGATTVSAGVLAANGSLANTTTTIQSGGTLQGSGTIGGSVTIESGGTLAPGNSIESIGTGALSFLGGSTYAYELQTNLFAGTPGVAGDLTYTTSTLDIASGALLTLTDLATSTALLSGSKLSLISYGSGWTGSELFTYLGSPLLDDSTFTLGANQWLFNYNDTLEGLNFATESPNGQSYITMTVIPEPGAALLGSLGLLALLRRRR